MYKFPVKGMKAMPEGERPTERLIRLGAQSLSAAELMAVVIRCGSRKESALEAATRMLSECGGPKGMAIMEATELARSGKIGRVRAAQLKAAMELGVRIASGDMGPRRMINNANDAAKLLSPAMRHLAAEQFWALMLDSRNGMLGMSRVSAGTVNSSPVHPREVFREAIARSSSGLIVAHNHPSGDPAPSPEDLAVTERLVEAGRLIGIEMIDHIIIGTDSFVSLKQMGILGERGQSPACRKGI